MNADEAINRIEQTIARETAQISSSFTVDPANNIDSRLASLELTRALNYAWWRISLSKRAEDYTICKTMTRGFNSAMSLFMTEHLDMEGVPNAPSTSESQKWADSVLTQLGLLRLAQRVIDLTRAGLIEFVDGSAGCLRFRTVANTGVAEDDDVAAQRWLSELAVSEDEAEYRDLDACWTNIQRLLRANVRIFEQHYIGYDTTPELDDFFHRLAVLHARRSFGHEAFAADAQFDGLPYAAFAATAITLVGWSLKHMAFATELSLMHPQLEVRNLLVPWSPLQWKAESLSSQLEFHEADAMRILPVFIGTHELFNSLAGIHDAPIPPFIPAARDRVHFSVASAQLLPYDLLLRRLREQYPQDYFRNVDRREAKFRENLRWVLPIKRVHFSDKAIELRNLSKSVTDVDAVVLSATGTLGLFQLKWQDPFGNDLRERRSRLSNLVPSANRWIQAVLNWLNDHGPQKLIGLAQFQGAALPEVRRVILFVVGRYHCNFLNSGFDDRAVWCTWPQLLKAVDTSGSTNSDPLVSLEEGLRAQRDPKRRPARAEVGTLRLRDFAIETRYGS